MITLTRLCRLLTAATIVWLSMPRLAAAYLDPGTGSYMLQLLIATGLGLMFSIKVFWKKIQALVQRLLHKEPK